MRGGERAEEPRYNRLLQGLRFPWGKPHFVGGRAAWCSAVTLPRLQGACRHGPKTARRGVLASVRCTRVELAPSFFARMLPMRVSGAAPGYLNPGSREGLCNRSPRKARSDALQLRFEG